MIPHRFKVDLPNELGLPLLKQRQQRSKRNWHQLVHSAEQRFNENGAPVLHYYSMGKSEVVKRIALKCLKTKAFYVFQTKDFGQKYNDKSRFFS